MRLPRVGLLASSCAFGALLSASDADAQPKGAPPSGPARSSTQFTLRREAAGGAELQAARGRARAGDCAGALPAFDAALRTSIDPTVRRDRGLCHENLGQPFPAIDDYRAYLTARPEAPDAEQIRQRLAALEAQTGTGSISRSPVKERDRDAKGSGGGAEATASFSVGTSGASGAASADSSASTKEETNLAGSRRNYDVMVAQEKLADDAEASPLRYGSGVVLGPFVHLPRFWVGKEADTDLAYGVGAAIRYSTGRAVSIISELGYGGIGTSGETSSRAGPLLMGGIELRLPVSRFASDHILLRGGLGYERHVISGTRAVTDNVLGRFALGYRHVFGPAIGLELLADGGPAYVVPETGDSRLNAVIGGSVAFVVGF